MNFEELFKQIVQTCKQQMRDVPGDKFIPLCFFIKNEKVFNMVLFDVGETPKEKAGVYTTLALTARKNHCEGVILVTDNWVSTLKQDQALDVMPSEDPNRQAALVVSALMVDPGLSKVNIIPYHDVDGYMIPLEEEEHQMTGDGGGLLSDIFTGVFQMPASMLGEIEQAVQSLVDVKHIPLKQPSESDQPKVKEIFRSALKDPAAAAEAGLMGQVYNKLLNHPDKSDGTLN